MPKLVKPIQQAFEAKPHSPVYRMHRYFARRPHSVFAELMKHYSNPSDVVLDPFCGGGVTLVEGLIQQRRVVGFDINPLAIFITRMELADIDWDELKTVQQKVSELYQPISKKLFSTSCRHCGASASVKWFEYSAVAECKGCLKEFSIASAEKKGVGNWSCPRCGHIRKFSVDSETKFEAILVAYVCANCGVEEIISATEEDRSLTQQVLKELEQAEEKGLWIPNAAIPDCNMQRESALFKKGILQFRQLFTPRHLLSLALLRATILSLKSPLQDWLLFAFSSALRYTNRMVTRNPSWRGDRPLEWAKPGFWLPPVFLEANVLEEFLRRCDAILRGKKDYLSKFSIHRPNFQENIRKLLTQSQPAFHVSTQSSTNMPLPDNSIDVIITDPPYGSYVHYADLCNFWAVWLPEIEDLGQIIDNTEEAVIARKKFPGAKDADEYQKLLEGCFLECARVLKPQGYMVLTFHNREPRAWAALLVAATRAGFELPPNGVIYQGGIPSYKHTAQSRRAGSVIGDFILSFRKPKDKVLEITPENRIKQEWVSEKEFVKTVRKILEHHGSLTPNALLAQLYVEYQPKLLKKVQLAVAQGETATSKLIEDFDAIQLFDSHRRQLLEEHFRYKDGTWSLLELQ